MFRRHLRHSRGALQRDLKLGNNIIDYKAIHITYITVFLQPILTIWVPQTVIKNSDCEMCFWK